MNKRPHCHIVKSRFDVSLLAGALCLACGHLWEILISQLIIFKHLNRSLQEWGLIEPHILKTLLCSFLILKVIIYCPPNCGSNAYAAKLMCSVCCGVPVSVWGNLSGFWLAEWVWGYLSQLTHVRMWEDSMYWCQIESSLSELFLYCIVGHLSK